MKLYVSHSVYYIEKKKTKNDGNVGSVVIENGLWLQDRKLRITHVKVESRTFFCFILKYSPAIIGKKEEGEKAGEERRKGGNRYNA